MKNLLNNFEQQQHTRSFCCADAFAAAADSQSNAAQRFTTAV